MFSGVFSELLQKRNLTVYKAAKDTGISESLLGSYKNGKIPGSKNLSKLAEYFGVTTDYLLGNSPAETLDEKIERKITDGDIKFALFGDVDIDDDVFEDIKRLAKIQAELKLQKNKLEKGNDRS